LLPLRLLISVLLQLLPQGFYLNLATKTPQEAPPVLGRGGLMADAMGLGVFLGPHDCFCADLPLGKTLTMLSLIVTTKKDVPTEFSNATLIGSCCTTLFVAFPVDTYLSSGPTVGFV
jgi:hypothetical protein